MTAAGIGKSKKKNRHAGGIIEADTMLREGAGKMWMTKEEKKRRKEARETMRRLERKRMPFETIKEYNERIQEMELIEAQIEAEREVARYDCISRLLIIGICCLIGLILTLKY